MGFNKGSMSAVRIFSLILERAATVFLAILMLRLHCKMASFRHTTFESEIMFLRHWVLKERTFTLVTILALLVAFILSVIDEIIVYWYREKPQ